MEETRHQKFLREIMGSDMDFFEKFLKDLPEEKLQKFLDENPELSEELFDKIMEALKNSDQDL